MRQTQRCAVEWWQDSTALEIHNAAPPGGGVQGNSACSTPVVQKRLTPSNVFIHNGDGNQFALAPRCLATPLYARALIGGKAKTQGYAEQSS